MGNIARMPHPDGIVTNNTKSSESINADNIRLLPKADYKPGSAVIPAIQKEHVTGCNGRESPTVFITKVKAGMIIQMIIRAVDFG